MKRKQPTLSPSENELVSKPTGKKLRAGVVRPAAALASPRRRAFERQCKFLNGEKIIGFYGGWPYVGKVIAIVTVNMSFGATYLMQVRWNGFSGKRALSWVSEFDLVKHNEASLKLKSDMEQAQKDQIKEAGGKVDRVKFRKIFLKVVSDFRGKKLAPFPARFSPYPEEWQQMVRITAMPKSLVDHLTMSEGLVNECRLLVSEVDSKSFFDVLKDWVSLAPDRQVYMDSIIGVFNEYFMKLLVYKFEIPSVVKKIILNKDKYDTNYSKLFPVEFGLRLLNILPELLTAATVGQLTKSAESSTIASMIEFINSHQSFMAYLEQHVEELLSCPVRKASSDEPLPESYGIDFFERHSLTEDTTDSHENRAPCGTGETRTDTQKNAGKRHKRKTAWPVQKLPPTISNIVASN